jgi:hypothetical protein
MKNRILIYFEKLDKMPLFQLEIARYRRDLGLDKHIPMSEEKISRWFGDQRKINPKIHDEITIIQERIRKSAAKLLKNVDFERDSIKVDQYVYYYLFCGIEKLKGIRPTRFPPGLYVTSVGWLQPEMLEAIKRDYEGGMVVFIAPDANKTSVMTFLQKEDDRLRRHFIKRKTPKVRSANKDNNLEIIKDVWNKYGKFDLEYFRKKYGKRYYEKYEALADLANKEFLKRGLAQPKKLISAGSFRMAVTRAVDAGQLNI